MLPNSPLRARILAMYAKYNVQRPVARRGPLAGMTREFKVLGFKGGFRNLGLRALRTIPIPGAGLVSTLLFGEPRSVDAAEWKTRYAVDKYLAGRGGLNTREQKKYLAIQNYLARSAPAHELVLTHEQLAASAAPQRAFFRNWTRSGIPLKLPNEVLRKAVLRERAIRTSAERVVGQRPVLEVGSWRPTTAYDIGRAREVELAHRSSAYRGGAVLSVARLRR
ncbi:MAG: hypothetical protein WC607_04825 [Candidatus Micrarchaeia archaeon]